MENKKEIIIRLVSEFKFLEGKEPSLKYMRKADLLEFGEIFKRIQ